MDSRIVQLTEERATIISQSDCTVGKMIDFTIDFPKGASIDYLQLSGVIRRCEEIKKGGSLGSVLKLKKWEKKIG